MFNRKEYLRQYYQENKATIKLRSQQWRKENPEKMKSNNEQYRTENPEKMKEYKRAWGIKNREKVKASARKWANNNKEKRMAQGILLRAVYKGEIKRGICVECGNANTDGHHEDYSKPLDVIWLCRSHHRLLHERKNL